eukprot:3778536-Rhodomonas_salina.1
MFYEQLDAVAREVSSSRIPPSGYRRAFEAGSRALEVWNVSNPRGRSGVANQPSFLQNTVVYLSCSEDVDDDVLRPLGPNLSVSERATFKPSLTTEKLQPTTGELAHPQPLNPQPSSNTARRDESTEPAVRPTNTISDSNAFSSSGILYSDDKGHLSQSQQNESMAQALGTSDPGLGLAIQADVANLHAELREMRSEMQAEVGHLKSEVQGVRSDLSSSASCRRVRLFDPCDPAGFWGFLLWSTARFSPSPFLSALILTYHLGFGRIVDCAQMWTRALAEIGPHAHNDEAVASAAALPLLSSAPADKESEIEADIDAR